MKSFLTLGAGLALAVAVPATAASFDFETTPTGGYVALNVTDSGLGLTVTTQGAGFVIVETGVDLPSYLGSRAIIGSLTSSIRFQEFRPLRFTFDQALASVTFAFGDNGGDSDSPVSISAFDGLGVLLGTQTTSYDANVNELGTLTLSYSGAVSFLASSGSTQGNENSLAWEVQSATVGPVAAAVPEPATWGMMLVGFGLIGASVRRRQSVGVAA